ncbi:MAG: type II secretion system F family protein [Halobacteria archaeon]
MNSGEPGDYDENRSTGAGDRSKDVTEPSGKTGDSDGGFEDRGDREGSHDDGDNQGSNTGKGTQGEKDRSNHGEDDGYRSPKPNRGFLDRITGLRVMVRRKVREREGKYREYRKVLNQAHVDVPYDIYITRVHGYTAAGAAVGLLVGLAATLFLIEYEMRVLSLFEATALTVLVGVLGGVLARLYRYYTPLFIASVRAKKIESGLPYAVVFLYALNEGGMDILESIRRLEKNRAVYGEVSDEFAVVVRRTDVMGEDLTSAIEKLRETTPSKDLQVFLDDLRGTVASGGDVSDFLRTESERFLEYTKKEQKAFLETLSMMGSMYIMVFVLAPVLALITLLVVQMLGTDTLPVVYVLIYAVLPVGILCFIWVIDLINETPEVSAEIKNLSDKKVTRLGSERIENFKKWRRRRKIKERIRDPIGPMMDHPVLSLFITIPVAVTVEVFYLKVNRVAPYRVTTAPVEVTILLFVVPALIVLTPVSVLTHLKERKRSLMLERFPYKLTTIANTNKSGLSLRECIGQVADSSKGYVGEQFRLTENDIKWNHDVEAALIRLSNRVKIPEISRKMAMIAEARTASGNLHVILEVAAADAHEREELRVDREKKVASHLAVIFLGFMVYLMVLVTLDVTYVSEISSTAGVNQTNLTNNGMAGIGGALREDTVPVDKFRMFFYHSTLITGFGNGLIIGKISSGTVLTGIKYSIVFMIFATAAFVTVT